MLEIIPPWPKLGQGIQLEMTLHPPLFLHFTLDAHIFAPWKTLHFRCQCNTKQMQNKYKSVYYGFAENHHHHHHHHPLVLLSFMLIIIILITRPTLASYSSLPKGVVPNSIWCHVNGWNIYLTWLSEDSLSSLTFSCDSWCDFFLISLSFDRIPDCKFCNSPLWYLLFWSLFHRQLQLLKLS